ncbi:hypothetical protein [Cytobacillus gottheilii]|uniref:hypothetical protein n=1 Tax=Cytobacillus gottheilii TaxID=859144 RepID=UPI0024956DEB|nr:hypothetical protein [Cytobacillus gottheilii]
MRMFLRLVREDFCSLIGKMKNLIGNGCELIGKPKILIGKPKILMEKPKILIETESRPSLKRSILPLFKEKNNKIEPYRF